MTPATTATAARDETEPIFGVHGEVVEPDGSPLAGRLVRAFDRALCDWRLLGEARSDNLGRYAITYDRDLLEEWGKSRADLKVEVRDGATGDIVLAASPLILSALPQETVNFSIGDERYRGPSEYTRVERALASQVKGDELWRCLDASGILILARDVGLRSSLVAYFVKAQRWAADYRYRADALYALMRRGESTRIDALLARPLASLWAVLVQAKQNRVIDAPLDSAARKDLAAFQQRYLAKPDLAFGRLLDTTRLTKTQRATFTERLVASDLTGDAFWNALVGEAELDVAQVDDSRALFDLQAFTGDNSALTARLRDAMAARTPRDTAAFSLEKWRDSVLVDPGLIPEDLLPDGSERERRTAYARLLYAAAEQHSPTASLAAQMSRDPTWQRHTLTAFAARNPAFDFRDQRLLNLLRDQPDVLDGLPDPGAARDELLHLEQLFHLVPPSARLTTIDPLWEAGMRSAPQIAYLGRHHLRRRTRRSVPERVINDIYRRAVHVTSMALSLYLRYNPRLNSLSSTALRLPQLPASAELARAALTMPEWEQLFGSADACECSPYESAFSPAAYLVDCLNFLQKAVDAGNNNALDELLARRPDLGTLQLTRENTETELPHIDLVIEILEAIVASPDGETLPAMAIGPTTWDSEVLQAQPEHMQPAAYDTLRQALYPFDLPFDLWTEEGRRYLAHMGIARDELMDVMPAKPDVGRLEIATDALGMSRAEREVICTPETQPAELALRWGIDLAAGTLGAQLGTVDTLLTRSRLDYAALLRLLATRYVNPDGAIAASFAGGPCALDGAVLVGEGGTELTGVPFRELLDRVHRFLRLQRRMACTESELDVLIAALGFSDFDEPNCIPHLADVKALRDALGVGVAELSTWWSDRLDTRSYEDDLPSQYEATFLDTSLFPDTHSGIGPDLRNDVFALTADRTDLAITTSSDAALSPWLAETAGASLFTLHADYAAYVQSATGLTVEDLQLLIQTELLPKDAGTGHVALNLSNVSMLYRAGSLARALDLTMIDLLRLLTITPVAPIRLAGRDGYPFGLTPVS